MIFGCKVRWLHAKVHVGCTFRNNVFGSMFFVLIFGILVEKWIPQLLLEADFWLKVLSSRYHHLKLQVGDWGRHENHAKAVKFWVERGAWATVCKRVWCRWLSGELMVECSSRGGGFESSRALSFANCSPALVMQRRVSVFVFESRWRVRVRSEAMFFSNVFPCFSNCKKA